MASIYELTEQAKQLYELLESDVIDEQAFFDTLEAIGADEKIDTYCKIINQLKADGEMYKAERDRLYAKQQAAANQMERMRTALTDFMLATGKRKEKTALFSVSISSRQSVEITNEAAIPKQYKEPQPDKILKTEISKAIKAGETIDGAELVIKDSLTIR